MEAVSRQGISVQKSICGTSNPFNREMISTDARNILNATHRESVRQMTVLRPFRSGFPMDLRILETAGAEERMTYLD